MFLVAANTRQALVGQKEWITTGSSGIQVQFLFSADWDGLAKFAVFRNAEIEESVIPIALPASGLTELPAENCAAEYVDEKVYVGVYGTDGLGHIIIPTIWVSLGVLKEGAAYEGMDPPQPTQDMWAQILAIAQNAGAENAAAAEQSAEEAEASKEAIQDMNVEAETLPDESPLTVTKEVDPETGAVTLVFGLTRGPKGTKGDDGYSPTITITPIQGGHRFTVTDEDHPTGQSFDVMNGAPGAPGSPGQDGYSPAITITTITGGHRFTVTDEDHPTGQSFDVMDGTKGDQGYSPAVTITTITGGHRVTITDEDHPTGQSFDVLDGASDAGQVTFDPTQTYQSGTVGKELSDQSNAISQKQDAPSSAGTAGQVLGLDSNLDPVWVNQSGGGDVSNCAPIIINTASGDVATFADGADNRQIRKIVGTIETAEGGSGWTGCVFGNSDPAPTDKAFSFLPRQSGSGDPSPTNVRSFLPYTLTLDDDSQVTILGGDVKFNGDGSADVTETWAKCTIAEIRSQAIGPSAYATGMFSTILYYQTYKIEPSGVTNVMSDSYKQTDVVMGSMADDTIRNFNGTIYLRDTRYSTGTELVAGMGNAVIAYEIKKTQERPVYHLSNSAQLLPILAENGYALQTLPINWQTVAGTISNGTVTLNEDGSVDLINSDSGTNYHLTGIGSLMTYFGQNNIWIDTGSITECDYPADTKLYVDGLTAPDEDMIANANIASGKYFVVNNQLYLSTAAIAAGASIVPGTNCTATNLAEALNALNT